MLKSKLARRKYAGEQPYYVKRVKSASDLLDYVPKEIDLKSTLHSVIANVKDFQMNHAIQKMTEKRRAAGAIKTRAQKVQKCPILSKSDRPMSMARTYFDRKPDLARTVNQMIANVHRTMKTTSPPKIVKPSIPAPIAKSIKPPKSAKSSKSILKKRSTRSNRRMVGGQNRIGMGMNSTIPAVKASLAHKTQQMMRRGCSLSEISDQNSSYQRRMREVLQQKSVLQNMLTEHRKLQRDRQNIVMDIQKMRNDLDRIRQKLDVSLQCLKTTSNFANKLVTGSKKGANASHVNFSVGPNRVTGGKTTNAPKRKIPPRSNSVAQKRINVLPSMRRKMIN